MCCSFLANISVLVGKLRKEGGSKEKSKRRRKSGRRRRNIDKEGKEEGRRGRGERGGGEAQILISDGAPSILLLVVRTWRA